MKRSKFVIGSMVAISTPGAAFGQSQGGNGSRVPTYRISAEVASTRLRTILPDVPPWPLETIYPYEVSKYAENGYGGWKYGPGLETVRRFDIMSSSYSRAAPAGAIAISSAASNNVASLVSFFTISDIHISDKESPAQVIYLGYHGGISSAYSPVMLYTTHVLDAAVQTINAVHKLRPFDFGISLGDASNNTQYNETRWYIDVLDGKKIRPGSGVTNVPEYEPEYQAAGLDPSIPWYQTLGNHDHFFIGSFPVSDYLRAAYLGDEILNLGNVLSPEGTNSRGFYTGSIDGTTRYGDLIGVGPVRDFPTPPKVRAADPNRRSLSRKEWMSEFFRTSSQPVGHGFSKKNLDGDFASYSFEPKANVPVKTIVLDDTQNEHDESVDGYGHGSLDKSRYEWLVNELDQGQKSGQLMILACHVPIGVEPPGSVVGWWSRAYVSEAQLIAKLHEYPNLILWIAGHRHLNAVTAFPSPDPAHPELGFWEIETSSLRDYPQQFRTIDIVRNADDTLSIFTTNVDPAVADGSPAAISRSYAVAAQQLFKNPMDPAPGGSYNAELLIPLSAAMQAKIRHFGTPIRS
jgi:metallophosphoesterase (TIGR03768 family)